MENLACCLCAGSPEIRLYEIRLTDNQKKILNKKCNITTDICIGREIELLINNGVITYGCCCGHGKNKPECLVDIKSKKLLNKLGYELHEYSEEHSEFGKYSIYLKTDIQCELRKILADKVFRYLGER